MPPLPTGEPVWDLQFDENGQLTSPAQGDFLAGQAVRGVPDHREHLVIQPARAVLRRAPPVTEGEQVGDARGGHLRQDVTLGGRCQLPVLVELKVPDRFPGR